MRRVLILLVALLTACSSGGTSATAHRPPSTASRSATPAFTGSGGTTSTLPTKVLVVVLENHSQSEVLRAMPYLKGLASRYGRTTAYKAVTHPSLPNYLALAGGSTFGIRDDKNPSSHPLRSLSVFGQALRNHRTARAYAESMSSACKTVNVGRYAVRHNPWAYFADERSLCSRYDVPMGTTTSGALRTDTVRGTLPNVGFVVPNTCSDAHDCSLSTADAWVKKWVPVWVTGPDFRAGRLAVVITFDEDDRRQSNTVLTVVISPRVTGRVVSIGLTHYNLSAWLSRVAGGMPLRSAATKASLGKAFGLARA